MADWASHARQVRQAGKALIALGVKPGDHVAIVGHNRPEWVVFHLGALCVGAVCTGVYPAFSAEQVRDLVAHADASVVLVEDRSRAEELLSGRLDRLRQLVTLDLDGGTGELPEISPRPGVSGLMDWERFQATGDSVPDSAVDERIDRLDPDAMAALVYTPGTEGRPRGVMLSHRNLAWTAAALRDLVDCGPGDTTLSYLPLAHILEQLITIYLPATAGSAVYFAPSLDTVARNLRDVQPSLLFGLPRIWARFHAAISGNLASSATANQSTNRSIVDWVRRVARTVNELRNQGKRPGPTIRLKHRIARYLLLSRLAPALGVARARFCASSNAPIAEDLLDFFSSLDVVIHELYGLTETCAIASGNRPGATRFGTAGQPLAGVDMEIAGDGEILIRGPHVFMGYYKDEQATRAILKEHPGGSPGVWLHTGDLGRIDSDGFVTVIGRKHEIITAGSARIAPQPIEAALETSPLIQTAVLTGHGRPHATALITLDPDAVAGFLAREELAPGPMDQIPALSGAVQAEIDRVNSLLAEDEAIVRFTILDHGFTVERGELTPMFTLRRSAIRDHHAQAIAAMYDEP